MPYLLNVVYLILILCFSPYLAYAAVRYGKYRDGWGPKCFGLVPRRAGNRPCLWLHAVSVGEVNLLQPILSQLGQEHPAWECVISTTTRTGLALARKKYAGCQVFYCPLDFTWSVRHAILRIRPSMLVLAELELWPNLIRAARQHGARVAIVNARLSDKSYRGYRRIRPLTRRILEQVDLIAAQDETYAARFRALGAPAAAVHVTGSIKFDGAQTERDNPATLRLREVWRLPPDAFILLAGSTQEPEERMAISALRAILPQYPDARLIVVPRHPERFEEVARLLDQSGLAWQRRSRCEEAGGETTHILLVDVVGELGAWWGIADVGFVGGSMGRRGGQNMIEPAGYGVAVCFGPNTWNFRDVVQQLLQREAAVVVQDEPELIAFVRRCLDDPAYARELGTRARSLVLEQQGATRRTINLLAPLVSPEPAPPQP
ncbi:MAG: 3-deoxy-D-manno-octulosonic acid transferase [Planctomycetaceae bacterium]|nr:3-deoxy-D-manno-octulosonic acid transferase [Planctomycetaceae bacterium]